VYDGYVSLEAGTGDDMASAKAVPIAGTGHWNLYDIILVPSKREKKVGSTEGHALAQTSPLFEKRLQDVPDRQKRAIEAIRHRDFDLLTEVAEADSRDMHAVMMTSTPPLDYLSSATKRITDTIEVYRRMKHIPVFYTMDAGATVHLICPEESKEEVLLFAHGQTDCTVYVAHTGTDRSV